MMTYFLTYVASTYIFWLFLSVGIEQKVYFFTRLFTSVSKNFEKGDEKRYVDDPSAFRSAPKKEAAFNHVEYAKLWMVLHSIFLPFTLAYVVINTTTWFLKTVLTFLFTLKLPSFSFNKKNKDSNSPTTF